MSEDRRLVKDLEPNGKSRGRSHVTHEKLMQGGTLKLAFSSEKEVEWSHRTLRAPFSEIAAH